MKSDANQYLLDIEAKMANYDLNYLRQILTSISQEKAKIRSALNGGVTETQLEFWDKYRKSLDATIETLHTVWDYYRSV